MAYLRFNVLPSWPSPSKESQRPLLAADIRAPTGPRMTLLRSWLPKAPSDLDTTPGVTTRPLQLHGWRHSSHHLLSWELLLLHRLAWGLQDWLCLSLIPGPKLITKDGKTVRTYLTIEPQPLSPHLSPSLNPQQGLLVSHGRQSVGCVPGFLRRRTMHRRWWASQPY